MVWPNHSVGLLGSSARRESGSAVLSLDSFHGCVGRASAAEPETVSFGNSRAKPGVANVIKAIQLRVALNRIARMREVGLSLGSVAEGGRDFMAGVGKGWIRLRRGFRRP